MKRLSATARVLDTLSKIASVCCIVGACIIAAAAVLLFGLDDASMIEFTGLELGFLNFELAQMDLAMIRSTFLCIMLPAFVVLGFGWLVLRVIRQILAPMKKGQPFDTAVSAKLRKLCWLTLGGGFLSQASAMAAAVWMYKACDFATLFLNEKITGVEMKLDMDLTFVVLALIWYMLSCVFRYGEELQRQSDETL